MAGVINRAVAASGVIAFQDRQNPQQFVYFPGSGQAVLGDTLEQFDCSYYGIGGQAQWVQAGPGKYMDLAGGVITGKLRFDATAEQKAALLQEIGRIYEIDDAQLVPAVLESTKAKPVFGQGVADLGGNSKYAFPDTVQVGSSFNYAIDSGNSLFPQLIAAQNVGPTKDSSPAIGMNISGIIKVYGEPFEARMEADLKQVWEYVRDQVDFSAKLGWFNLTSNFDSIAQKLMKDNIIRMTFVEGRADSTFGLQLLESTRKVFEAINAQITAGEGMFRFEPNPAPQEPKDPKSWFSDLLPWSVGLNMSFIRNSFQQSIKFDEKVSFTGMFSLPITSSFNLGVACGEKTKDMFHDRTLAEDGCITKEKLKALQARITKEVDAKNVKIEEWEAALIAGKINLATYETLVASLNTRMLSEQSPKDTRSVADIIAEVEKYAYAHAGGTGRRALALAR